MKSHVRVSSAKANLWQKVVLISATLFVLFTHALFAGGRAELSGSQARTSSQTQYPMTVVDGLGNTVLIEQAPQRIASLTLFTDEVLFDLVDGERLAAITFLAADEVFSNVAQRAAEVEMPLELNVEALIELNPDIIFVANWSDPAKLEQLRRTGLTVYTINSPVTMDGIKNEILTLGRLLNAEGPAQDIVSEMDRILQEVADALTPLPAHEQRTALDYNSWGSSSGIGSSWNAILNAARVKNAVAVFQADDYGQVPVSKELLVELSPDIIFLPGWIWGDPEGAAAFEQDVKSDPSLQTVTAIREDRVYLVPENLKSTFSQYIVESVRQVAQLAYPEYMP